MGKQPVYIMRMGCKSMPCAVPRITTYCNVCGKSREWRQKEIDGGRGVYCSEKCRRVDAINRNKRGDEHYKFKGGLQTTRCSYCGIELQRKYYEFNKYKYFFCNHKCSANFYKEHYSGENGPGYKTGICCDGYHYTFKRDENKNKVRQLFNNMCIVCGKKHIDGDENLIVHHIYKEQKAFPFEDAKYVCVCRHCHVIIHNSEREWRYWTSFFIELIEVYMNGVCWVDC